jgi:hypothetical protein
MPSLLAPPVTQHAWKNCLRYDCSTAISFKPPSPPPSLIPAIRYPNPLTSYGNLTASICYSRPTTPIDRASIHRPSPPSRSESRPDDACLPHDLLLGLTVYMTRQVMLKIAKILSIIVCIDSNYNAWLNLYMNL